ncbi:MAG: TolC family protein [Desulforhabdus sp.]|jgi:multidrug efflux system outer membrane protein|nr:TolC family protein [Desulforhabdus sp.]
MKDWMLDVGYPMPDNYFAKSTPHLYRSVLMALVVVFLTGCTMIPKYTRPEAPVPETWPTGPAYKDTESGQGASAVDDLQWRQFFRDKRLQKVIETALQNNRDLRVAALNVERARALYRIQRAELLPIVDATASGFKQRIPADISGTDRAPTVEQYSVEVGITSWEIDFFGRIRSLEKSALEEYFATEHARRSVQILLLSEVASAYMTLAAYRENLELAKSTLESQLASYNLIRRRFEVGIAP